jgi:aspartyl-tRNA(Asn)/glutamyl-tRNA(Gln) amidotransferase subunit B
MSAGYEAVIGLEVHAQLATRSKLFCGCSTAFGAPPNTHVCPTCLGLPGSLPVPNGGAVEMAMRAALALQCQVRARSVFARKNYFYPDLAKNYQISQYELPLNEHGKLVIESDGTRREVGIHRIHLEEDAAKNLHGAGPDGTTLVDFNRAGVPLMEIVSEPDLRGAGEAEEYLKRLREILLFLRVNDGNLEEGSFRCDANVSVRPVGDAKLGTRTELKNINSFRFVRRAIEGEIARQIAVVSGGGRIVQETRHWDEARGTTVAMRGKEEAMDYRYFPDPDLPPVAVAAAEIDRVREHLPELPAARRARWQKDLGVTAADAGVLTAHPGIADHFEAVAAALSRATGGRLAAPEAGKRAANFIQAEVLRHVATAGLDATIPVAPDAVAELLALVEASTISGKMAKDVCAEMIATGRTAAKIVAARGMAQVSERGPIEKAAREAMAQRPDNVAHYRAGKTAVLGWFVGQVMKATGGAANPKLVNDVLRDLLGADP